MGETKYSPTEIARRFSRRDADTPKEPMEVVVSLYGTLTGASGFIDSFRQEMEGRGWKNIQTALFNIHAKDKSGHLYEEDISNGP